MSIERHEVLFPNGEEYSIGGQLICSDEAFKRIAPDLWESLNSEDTSFEATNKKVFQIVKFYNKEDPNLNEETFVCCVNSARKVMEIWNGIYEPQKKTN